MWYIRRIDPVSYISGLRYVTFVGSGGKSSWIEYLARREALSGRKTVITTTTKIWAHHPYVLLADIPSRQEHSSIHNPLRTGSSVDNGKLTSIPFVDLLKLGKHFDLLLIEADGAKGKPLKCPSSYEPVIPPFSEIVFVVAGLDSLYGTVRNKVFRWELFRDTMNVKEDEAISPQIFKKFFSREVLLKGIGKVPFTVILNKYDRLNRRGIVLDIARDIIQEAGAQSVLISCVPYQVFYEIRNTSP